MLCQNCGTQEATQNWVGEGGSLAFVHGFVARWCEPCVLREQIKYATKAAEQLPELKRRLSTLDSGQGEG